MLNRHQRDGDPDRGGQLSRPLATTEHQLLACYLALISAHANRVALFDEDFTDRAALNELRPFHARALGQRLRDVRGAGLPIRGQIGRANDV